MEQYKTLIRTLTIFAGLFSLLQANALHAHVVPYMVVNTDLRAEGSRVYFKTSIVAPLDVQGAEEASQEEKIERVETYYSEYFAVLYGKTPQEGTPCGDLIIDGYILDTKKPETVISGSYDCNISVTDVDRVYLITDVFSDAFVTYDHYVTVQVGDDKKDFIYNQRVWTNFELSQEIIDKVAPPNPDNTFDLSSFKNQQAGNPESPLPYVLKRFTKLGAEHIFFGFDHVLFLLAVILVVLSIRNMLILVTSFTIAHSITLLLAGFGVITLTARVVEPVIAFSIVFVALRNLIILSKEGTGFNLKERWISAFGFGLVHGLGFAGALSDVHIPSQYFVPALLTFNVGVELGQLAILVAVVPILKFMERKQFKYRKHVLFLLSGVVGIVALYWFVERIGVF